MTALVAAVVFGVVHGLVRGRDELIHRQIERFLAQQAEVQKRGSDTAGDLTGQLGYRRAHVLVAQGSVLGGHDVGEQELSCRCAQ